MRIFKVGEKLIPDAVLLNLLGKEKGISFYIKERRFEGDRISVLVRGELKSGMFSRLVEEEWVEIDLKELAKQFCLEKYGSIPKENSLEFKREYLRAKLVGTRYAVGLAKKRIEARFTGREFREAFERALEEVELLSIYTRADRVYELMEKRRRTIEYLQRVKERHPEIYEEIRKRFFIPEHVEFRTEEQSVKIHALLKELNMSDEEYRKLLKRKFGVSSSLALTKKEATRLIQILENMKRRKEDEGGNRQLGQS